MPLVILVIEFDADQRRKLSLGLENEGYIVFEAADEEQGWELLQRIPKPEAIVIQISNSSMYAGIFLTRKESNQEFRDIPVIALGTHENLGEISKGMSLPEHSDPRTLIVALADLVSKQT